MRFFLLGLFVLIVLCQLSLLGIVSTSAFWTKYGEYQLKAYQEAQKEYSLKAIVGDYFRLKESRRIFCLMLLHLGLCIPATILLGRYLLG